MFADLIIAKQKAFLLLLFKLQADLVTSPELIDFLSVEKVGSTGLLIAGIWYFLKENKRLEKKYTAILTEREEQIEKLQKEKEGLLIKLGKNAG